MATTPADIPGLRKQISGLQNQAGTVQNKLSSSPTALGGEGTPTAYDIGNQESLQRIQGEIQKLNDQRLKTRWYGSDTPSNTPEEPSSPGLIGQGLDFISRPLYGIVGATKHVLGQGAGSLQQDVADNALRNKNTFGDVLKSSGVPWAVSAPLGLALDIGMDPMNWLTMGTGALVPRLAFGAYKGVQSGEGVIRGLGIAAKSGVLQKANTIGKYTPYVRKTERYSNLGTRSLRATDEYEALTGRTAANIVKEQGFGVGSYRIGLGKAINAIADATPGGRTVLNTLVYDPIEWVRQARIKDVMQDSLGIGVDLKGAVNAAIKGEPVEPFIAEAQRQVAPQMTSGTKPFSITLDSSLNITTDKEMDAAMAKLAGTGLEERLVQVAPKIVNDVDDASSIIKNPATYTSADPMENARRIASERLGADITLEEMERIVKSGALDETGVKWFDSMIRSAKDFRSKVDANGERVAGVGQKTMDLYGMAMSIFRAAKVAASPTSWMNAVVGNALMAHMLGVFDPVFIGRLRQAQALYRNKSGQAAFIDGLVMRAGGDADEIRRFLAENQTAARGTLGSLDFLNSSQNAEILLQRGRDRGLVPSGMKAEDIASDVKKSMDELAQIRMAAGTDPIRALLRSGKDFQRSDIGGGMMANEVFNSRPTVEMLDHIAKKAKENPSNMAWKLLDFTLNKATSGYEKIDQSYKMATFLHATIDGYTLNQLRQMRHVIDINPEELNKYARGGEYRYRLTPRTAIELSNVMFLNYNAMPSAVRVLRNFPILGSPFASFMYGMALKTGQTLAYNPSAFNKVSFAMNDFGGTKDPLEKKALEGKFYSYLNKPGMFRLPDSMNFFSQNPVYMNMTNMIPYYSLNMFNPTQTSYGNTVSERLAQTVQSSPILKDPVGSVLFDYLIQPLILDEAIRPQGQFGQPLYPVDAGVLEKTGYAARSLGEAFVPNIAAYAGLLTPESVADYIPSYRWRQLSHAKVGENQLGISSKEPSVSRTIRTLLQATGIPVQAPVNTSFAAKGDEAP